MAADYQLEAEQFASALGREAYRHGAGLQPAFDAAAIYERYERLFDLEQVRDLVAARHESKADRFLSEFAALHHLTARVQRLTDRIAQALAAAAVDWEGQALSLRAARRTIAGEPATARRHALERLVLVESARLDPLRRERWEMLHQEADRLDFPTYAALCDDLRGLNLTWLGDQARAILARTADRYYGELDRLLWRIGVERAEATPADLARLTRVAQSDESLPRADLLPALTRTLAGLGVDLDRQPNLSFDVEARPRKAPRAFCAAIRIPEEVRLVVLPGGGPDAYRALFHAAGHAEHFVHTDARLPFAYRWLGDRSLGEGYANLFEGLTQNLDWFLLVLGRRPGEGEIPFAQFLRLRTIRRAAASLLYEQELHSGGSLDDLPDRYREIMDAALGHRSHPEEHLTDVRDVMRVADTLRGWMFEAQLRAYLVKEYGEGWVIRRAAGDVVRDLWTRGQQHTADEVVRVLGYAGLDAEQLIEELA